MVATGFEPAKRCGFARVVFPHNLSALALGLTHFVPIIPHFLVVTTLGVYPLLAPLRYLVVNK